MTAECSCGKNLYPSYRRAVRVLLGCLRLRGGALRIYRCPDGRGWHLTSQGKREAA